MPAPQGVGVMNSGGEVLDWVLTFESRNACHEFFDYGLKRFRTHPDLKRPVATRRYQPYPGGRREDFVHDRPAEPIADRHPEGKTCPATAAAKSRAREGDVAVEIFGRVVDRDGTPRAESVRQEEYAQDHFLITTEMQKELARAVRTGDARIRMPDRLSRQIVTYAYLSHMDVRPLDNPRGGNGELRTNEFWLRKSDRAGWWRVEGTSHATGRLEGRGGHDHEVKLEWTGALRLAEGRIEQLLLAARGTEKLKYGAAPIAAESNRDAELRSLPAGRPIDLDAPVRYGLIGRAVAADQVRAGEIGKGNEPAGGGPPASFLRKMQRLQGLMRKRSTRGGPPAEARELLPRLQRHLRAQEFKEAERILDRLLRILE